jgi:hypothetical protein
VSEEADFHGARFSSPMTWKPQFDLMETRTCPRVNSIRKLVGLLRNQQNIKLLNIYNAFVRPIFEYASVAFISASETHFNKIQNIQNAAVKSILQLPSYVSNKLAHDVAAVPFIKDHLKLFTKKSMRVTRPLIKDLIQRHDNIDSHKSLLDICLSL